MVPRVVDGGSPERRNCAFAGGVAVSLYSLMYRHTDGSVLPASSLSLGATEVVDQSAFADAFAGIAANARGASDPSQTDFPVMTDVELELTCTSATFIAGDLVAAVRNGGATALENLKVKKTTSRAAAIGYVVANYATATTTVRVRLLSRVFPHSPPVAVNSAVVPVAVAADGSTQGDAAALTLNAFNNVSAADGTKGVILPPAAPGDTIDVYNAVATNGLKIYPQTGGAINGGTANAAIVAEGKTLSKLVTYNGLDWAAVYTVNT